MSTAPAVPAELDAEIAAAAEAENLRALEPDEAAAVNELRFIKAEVKRLEDRRDELTSHIKDILKGYKGATVMGKLIVSLTERAGQRRCDTDKLRIEFPQAYEACVRQGAKQSVLLFAKK